MIQSKVHDENPEIKASRVQKKKEQKRLWTQNNREKTRSYGRAFYQRNAKKRKAYSLEYARAHREERRQYSKEYYQRKKAENPNYVKILTERAHEYKQGDSYKDYRKKYYEKNKVKICRKRLHGDTYKSIEKVKMQYAPIVEQYFFNYPFEEYGDKIIRRTLYRNGVYRFHGVYDDCYDAGMLAYLYSIHRCAALNCSYVIPYIRKMVRIFMICALVIYQDAENLCQATDFCRIQLDADSTGRLY